MHIHQRVFLAALLASLTIALQAAPPTFQARETIPLSNAIVTIGDINGDGRADILAAIPTPGTTTNDFEISIQLNNGSGSYTQNRTVDLGPNFTPTAIVTGDFNQDGELDIAVLSFYQESLYILLQHAGSFEIEPIQILDNTQNTLNMAVADLNGDKLPDIVIPTASGALMLLNTGSGHFAAPMLATTSDVSFVAIADLNKDKKQDLILTNNICCYSSTVQVFLGDGHGGFDAPTSQPPLAQIGARIAVADFNADGKLDVAAVSTENYGVSISFGNGDGTFGAAETVPLPSTVPYGLGLTAGDLNGDGVPDIVAIANNSPYGASVTGMVTLINGGKGSFGVPGFYSLESTAGVVVLGNLNSYHFADALVSSSLGEQSSAISLLFNGGRGVFQDGILEPTAFAPEFMAAGDFNGDGRLDVAEVNGEGLAVFLNTGSNAAPFNPLATLPFYTGPIVAGDFNKDGKLDLVIVNGATGETLLGNGDGTFFLQPGSYSFDGSPSSVVTADMNGDGKLDLITPLPSILLGNGNGTFNAPLAGESFCYYGGAVAVADFNRDGKPDVVTDCNSAIYIFLGNGDGTLQYPISEYYENDVLSIAVGDFNRDGIPDVAFTSNPNFFLPASTEVTILIGTGNGTFQTGVTVPALAGNSGQIIAADFNDDGILDLAVLDNVDAAFSLLQGNGDGTFKAARVYGTATNPICMIAGKFRTPVRKGFPDLAFCSAPGIALELNNTE